MTGALITEAAVQKVCIELSRRLDLGNVTPRIIGRFSNVAVALDPMPIVARIATGTALLRDTLTFARREIDIAHFLAEFGAPVVPPCPAPLAGPHQIDAWTISLWRRIEVLPEPSDAVEAARRLKTCHALLRGYPNASPYWGAFDEFEELLAHPRVHALCHPKDRSLMDRQMSECRRALETYQSVGQTLHGDSHRNNVLHTSAGPLWTDWKDTIEAPVEWDLACLVTGSRITGQNLNWAETALAAYGPHDAALLELCIQARALFGAAWICFLAAENPERQQRFTVWLNWLRNSPGLG